MDTIFMNFKNSKTSDPHKLLLNLTSKVNLKRSDKYVALSNFSICYTWKNINKSYKNNEFKISAETWNEEFELPGGSYSEIRFFRLLLIYLKNMEKILIILQ